MFSHLFNYRLKILLKNKSIIFWSLFFPIILACFFKMAFSNLDNQFEFKTVSIGVVATEKNDTTTNFKESLTKAESNDKKLFKVTNYSLAKAKTALSENQISGYYNLTDSEPELVINTNGFNQTLMKNFLEQYLYVTDSINYIVQEKPEAFSENLVTDLLVSNNHITKISDSQNEPNSTILYFFTVIAMACMFGMNWGIKTSHDIQANQSATGMRMGMNPLSKAKVVLANLLAAFIIFFTEIMLVLAFIHFVLKVDFGERWFAILFTCLVSCLLSISLGSLVGNSIKGNYNLKNNLVTLISVFGGFLSGMMSPDVKYWMDQHVPLAGYLNPTNLVSDSLYKLFYYSDMTNFYINLTVMAGFIILANVANYLIMRRQTYVHI